MEIETVIDAHAKIGESPLWDPEHNLLYWADIKAPALFCFNPRTGENRTWPVESDIGAFALMKNNAALVALRTGLFRLDLGTSKLSALAPSPYDPALFRFNGGICDLAGRFWVGVMFDPLAGSPAPKCGQLYSFTLAEGLRAEDDRAELYNGLAWSRDGSQLFLSHSYENRTYLYAYDQNEGILGERKLFATLPDELGLPDGAAVDTNGGYWCCLHGGSRIRRYHPDGTVDRDIHLPVSQPTMCAFAGPHLDTLYVTSASDNMTDAQRMDEPLAGALFRLRPGERGIPRPWIAR